MMFQPVLTFLLFYISATTSGISPPPACWTPFPSQYSANGIKQNYSDLSSCQNYCISVPRCVAIDFYNSTKPPCSIHTDPNDLLPNNTWNNDTSVTQYRLNISGACNATTIPTTKTYVTTTTPLTTMTTKGNATTTHPTNQSETTTQAPITTATTAKAAAFSFLVEPTFGPIAGGTNVTVTCLSSDLNSTISAVYFGSELLGQIISRSGLNATIITPPADASTIGRLLLITVDIIPGSPNVSTSKFFTYAPNPEVHDVNPKTLTLSGGIRLTVSGSNLSSVATPLTRALVVVKRSNGSISNSESFAPCEPTTEGGTKMICLSPPIYIPDDFSAALYGRTYSPYINTYRRRRAAITNDRLYDIDALKISSRRTRQAEADVYTNQTYKNGQDTLDVYIGAVFDGYPRYREDILRDNPEAFRIFFPPSLTCPAESDFDPNTDEFIHIKGANMSRCCSADSYTIRLGNSFCNITVRTENQLTCRPPKIKPEQTQSDRDFCGQNIAILVEVGYWKYKCSCLKYTDSSSATLITIIVATVGSALILFVIIIVVSVVIKRRQKSKNIPQQDVGTDKTRGRKDMKLRSRRPDNDRRDLTMDDSRNDLHIGRDGYRRNIYPSEEDYYRGKPYTRPIEGSDHSSKYTFSDENDDYLEANDRGLYRGLPGNVGVYAGGNTRGNWNEDSYGGRQANDEIQGDFHNSRSGAERRTSPGIYSNQDRSYGHRMKY